MPRFSQYRSPPAVPKNRDCSTKQGGLSSGKQDFAWPVVSVMHSANSSFGHEAVEKAAAACARGDDAGDRLLANIPQTQHGRASALQLITDGVQADATLDDGQTC
ncbi:hypothetical protein CSPX01_15792 [Colletotrichum filicis]|nr:hypothetical protein CSPX01_15792 [Colletotrichum filicis]